jgi:hypothetical protein
MRMRERACAAAETHSSLLLLCHCHAARVRLVQQSHDAVVLACGSLFLMRSNWRRRSDASGGGSHAWWRWRACAERLTWIGLCAALVRTLDGSRRGGSCGEGNRRRVASLVVAALTDLARPALVQLSLAATEPLATFLAQLLAVGGTTWCPPTRPQRGTCTEACAGHGSIE